MFTSICKNSNSVPELAGDKMVGNCETTARAQGAHMRLVRNRKRQAHIQWYNPFLMYFNDEDEIDNDSNF